MTNQHSKWNACVPEACSFIITCSNLLFLFPLSFLVLLSSCGCSHVQFGFLHKPLDQSIYLIQVICSMVKQFLPSAGLSMRNAPRDLPEYTHHIGRYSVTWLVTLKSEASSLDISMYYFLENANSDKSQDYINVFGIKTNKQTNKKYKQEKQTFLSLTTDL